MLNLRLRIVSVAAVLVLASVVVAGCGSTKTEDMGSGTASTPTPLPTPPHISMLDQASAHEQLGWLVTAQPAAHAGQFYDCDTRSYIVLQDPHTIEDLGFAQCYQADEIRASVIHFQSRYPSMNTSLVMKSMLRRGTIDQVVLMRELGPPAQTTKIPANETITTLQAVRARVIPNIAVRPVPRATR